TGPSIPELSRRSGFLLSHSKADSPMRRILMLGALLGMAQGAAAQSTAAPGTATQSAAVQSTAGQGAAAQRAAPQITLREQNELLFEQLQQVHGLTDEQMRNIRAIFAHSGVLGQGNPAITQHPVTPQQCAAKLEKAGIRYDNAR